MARTADALLRTDGTVICPKCVVADRPHTRLRGLLGRATLGADEGLLIRPTASIHTFFMRFAIDVVFLDRAGVVLKIVSGLRPWRITASRRARCALELRAGEARARDLQPGDRLHLSKDARGVAQ